MKTGILRIPTHFFGHIRFSSEKEINQTERKKKDIYTQKRIDLSPLPTQHNTLSITHQWRVSTAESPWRHAPAALRTDVASPPSAPTIASSYASHNSPFQPRKYPCFPPRRAKVRPRFPPRLVDRSPIRRRRRRRLRCGRRPHRAPHHAINFFHNYRQRATSRPLAFLKSFNVEGLLQ